MRLLREAQLKVRATYISKDDALAALEKLKDRGQEQEQCYSPYRWTSLSGDMPLIPETGAHPCGCARRRKEASVLQVVDRIRQNPRKLAGLKRSLAPVLNASSAQVRGIRLPERRINV